MDEDNLIPGLIGALLYGPYQEARQVGSNIMNWARRNPGEAARLAAETAADISPLGGAKAVAYDAPRDLAAGRPGWAAFNALTGGAEIAARTAALPLMAMGSVARGVGRANNLAERERRLRGLFDAAAPRTQGTRAPSTLVQPEDFAKAPDVSPLIEGLAESEVYRDILRADVDRGREILGGNADNWYELGGMEQTIGELGGSASDFNLAGSAASARSPVINEIASAAASLYGRKRGMTAQQVRDTYSSAFPDSPKLMLMGSHYDRVNDFLDRGTALAPTTARQRSNAHKIPTYFDARQGAATPQSVLDTHELRRGMQAALADPELAALIPPELVDAVAAGGKKTPQLPIRNVSEYSRISSVYDELAREGGLASAPAFQAPRWVGGGQFTGLKTAPDMTFQEMLADVIAATARDRGMDQSPAGLRRLFKRVLEGDEFLLNYTNQPNVPLGGLK